MMKNTVCVEQNKFSSRNKEKYFFGFYSTKLTTYTMSLANGDFFSAKKMSPSFKVH